MNEKILVVEDESVVALSLCESLEHLGYQTVGPASRSEKALALAESEQPDLVLMDIRIKGSVDGIDTAAILVNRYDLPVIYLTAYTDDSTIARARNTKPYGYLVKPYEERELRSAVEIALYRHRSERRFRMVEKQLTTTLEHMGDGVVAVDDSNRVTYLNPVAAKMSGRETEEAVGLPLQEVLPIKDAYGNPFHPAQEVQKENPEAAREPDLAITTSTGKAVEIDHNLAPVVSETEGTVGAVLNFRSAEERLLKEKRRFSLQRLEALEKLSARIAHDYNNLLTIIQGNLHSLEEGFEIESSIRDAKEATARAARLTQQLLTFSHSRHSQKESFDLSRLVARSQPVLKVILGNKHKLKLHLTSEVVMVSADQGLVKHVVANLLSNARTSQPAGGVIELSVGTEEREPPPEVPSSTRWAVVTVRDRGRGIPSDNLPYIFEPFFTTKSEGQGSGLGLASSHGVVKSHGGWIEVDSEINEGTTFRIYLPLLHHEPKARAPKLPDARPPNENSKIVVVEDEDSLRGLVGRILKRRGYHVKLIEDGDKALQYLINEEHDFTLLLTDLQLPGELNGRRLAEELRNRGQDLKVAFMSGYSPEFTDPEFDPEFFLGKPFTPDELVYFVNRVLKSP